MIALILDTSSSSGSGGRPIRFLHRSCGQSARLERETPITSATVFIGNRPSAATAAAARHQPTPGEQLVWGNAMPTSHQAYRHTRLEGLFDHANLLRGRPASTTLNRRDDLNAIGRIGH